MGTATINLPERMCLHTAVLLHEWAFLFHSLHWRSDSERTLPVSLHTFPRKLPVVKTALYGPFKDVLLRLEKANQRHVPKLQANKQPWKCNEITAEIKHYIDLIQILQRQSSTRCGPESEAIRISVSWKETRLWSHWDEEGEVLSFSSHLFSGSDVMIHQQRKEVDDQKSH